MTPREFEDALIEALENYFQELQEDEAINLEKYSVQPFEEAGIMTINRGLVVKINDQEFQVTIRG